AANGELRWQNLSRCGAPKCQSSPKQSHDVDTFHLASNAHMIFVDFAPNRGARQAPALDINASRTCEPELLPGAVVDGVFVRGPWHGHVPLHSPIVSVIEALAGVGLRWSVQQAPGLEFLGLE